MGKASLSLRPARGSMRTSTLLAPIVAVGLVAGCGSEGREQATASILKRDLTRAPSAQQVEVATPVELQQTRTPPRTTGLSHRAPRPSRRVSTKPVPVKLAATSTPVLAVAPVPAPTVRFAGAVETASDRELPPGRTVTVIPASTGTSSGSGWDEDFPAEQGLPMGGSGGRCPPRGPKPGIGIAGRPPASLY
jgi:hypothetical protein